MDGGGIGFQRHAGLLARDNIEEIADVQPIGDELNKGVGLVAQDGGRVAGGANGGHRLADSIIEACVVRGMLGIVGAQSGFDLGQKIVAAGFDGPFDQVRKTVANESAHGFDGVAGQAMGLQGVIQSGVDIAESVDEGTVEIAYDQRSRTDHGRTS